MLKALEQRKTLLKTSFEVYEYESHLYVAPFMGLQGAAGHSAATVRNTVADHCSLVTSVTWFFYMHYTTHRIYSFTSHPKNKAIMVKCLA